MRHSVAVILLATALLWGVACSSDECLDNGSAIPLAAFFQKSTGSPVSVSNLSVYGLGATGDSCMADKESVSQVYMPLRATATVTQWVLDYNSDSLFNDTVTINYEPLPAFVSAECGAMYYFRIDGYRSTSHQVDSISIPDELIDNQNRVTIKIFFRG